MKYKYSIVMLCIIVSLSSCGKKDEPLTGASGSTNDIEIVENDTLLPEPTGEESIIPKYIGDNSSVENSQTDEKILFFYSESSEKSKEFDAILQSDQRPEVYSDIIKINFDDESEAKEDYGIVAPNSFVLVDESGSLVKKIENVGNIDSIINLYK